MAFTSAQLTALETAIAQGTRQVEYSDKKVTYRTLSEMIELRNLMKRELGLAAPSKRIYAEFDSAAYTDQNES